MSTKECELTNIIELCDIMNQNSITGLQVSAVVFAPEAEFMLRYFASDYTMAIDTIDLDVTLEDYRKEYCVTLTDDRHLTIEKLYYGGKYLKFYPNICYIDDRASCRILPHDDEADLDNYIAVSFKQHIDSVNEELRTRCAKVLANRYKLDNADNATNENIRQ